MALEGVVTISSNYGPKETVERLKAGIAGRGLDLFAEIDHAKNAKEVALSLPPETVLVFGSAAARHTPDAGKSGGGDRLAAQGPGLARCRRPDLDFL